MPDLEKPARQRSLKIEAIGDFAYRKIKPRIRLSGFWLEKISSLQTGELALRFKECIPTSQ
jgi:hypothetical protein